MSNKRKVLGPICGTEAVPHPGFLNGLCVGCGQPSSTPQDSKNALVIKHISTTPLTFCHSEAKRLRASNLNTLLENNKLCMVLDLDHTLVHSVMENELSKESVASLKIQLGVVDGLHHMQELGMWTKIRPGVPDMLECLSAKFQLSVYTMGERLYAKKIASLLDPTGRLFSDRVVSRHEGTSTDYKSLDVLLCDPKHTIILDDTVSVWNDFEQNVIQVYPYMYFHTKNGGNFRDKFEDFDTVSICTKVASDVHTAFFDGSESDVRGSIADVRRLVLEGCRLFFSDCDAENMAMAEQLGAEVAIGFNVKNTTHVVAKEIGVSTLTAKRNGKHVVQPMWLNACMCFWCRMPEEAFEL